MVKYFSYCGKLWVLNNSSQFTNLKYKIKTIKVFNNGMSFKLIASYYVIKKRIKKLKLISINLKQAETINF